MTRTLFAICLVLSIVLSVAILAGCSKRNPVLQEPEDNLAPSGLTAIPDTVKVTLTWTRNTEAEGTAGFSGYYVYCTSRLNGLTQLPPESLQYHQIPNCPYTTNTAVVTHDPRTNQPLIKGTKYYFYVRSMINGELSYASQWAISSPRPEGEGTIYGFVSADSTAPAYGIRSGFHWKTGASSVITYNIKMPYFVWRESLRVDTVSPYGTNNYEILEVTPSANDSCIRGYNAEDTTTTSRRLTWRDTTDHALGTTYTDIHKHGWAFRDSLALIDLVAEISGSQVMLTSPNINSTIPLASAWGAEGKETLIADLPGGWTTPSATDIDPLSRQVTLNVGLTGQAYQLYTYSGKYAKIRIDSVQTVGSTIKVSFHYAYQLVTGVKSF